MDFENAAASAAFAASFAFSLSVNSFNKAVNLS